VKWNFVSLVFSFSLVYALSGCSLFATRPLQEMSNADAALRAAKDLHADSLVPEFYRNAAENYHRAKREYRLKNFSDAKKYALRSTQIAEKAEFEAYRLGGASPEVAGSQIPLEGASLDTDEALKELSEPVQEEKVERKSQLEHGRDDHATKNDVKTLEKSLPSEKEDGQDYNEYLKQQEEQKAKQEGDKENYEASKPKPSGPLGPLGHAVVEKVENSKDASTIKRNELQNFPSVTEYTIPHIPPSNAQEVPHLGYDVSSAWNKMDKAMAEELKPFDGDTNSQNMQLRSVTK